MDFGNTCVGNIRTIDSQNQQAKFDINCIGTPPCPGDWSILNNFNTTSSFSAILKFTGCLYLLYSTRKTTTTTPPNFPVITISFNPGGNTVEDIVYSFSDENPNGIGTISVESICYGQRSTDPVDITVIWSYLVTNVVYTLTFDNSQLIDDVKMTLVSNFYVRPGCKPSAIIPKLTNVQSRSTTGSVCHRELTGTYSTSIKKDDTLQRLNRSEKSDKSVCAKMSDRDKSKRSDRSTRSEKSWRPSRSDQSTRSEKSWRPSRSDQSTRSEKSWRPI
jgi:hypothetical protein